MSELPQGWVKVTLASVANKIVDGSHNPPAKTDAGLPMLSARNVRDSQILFDDYRLVDAEAYEQEQRRTRITKGDILLTIVGAIGRTAIVQDKVDFVLQRSVAVIGGFGEVEPGFLSKMFESPSYQRWLAENAKGTAQKGVYLKAIGSSEILLAPLPEQRRIVAKIDSLTGKSRRARDHLDHIPRLVEKYKQAVLAAAFGPDQMLDWMHCRLESVLSDALIGLVRSKSEQTGAGGAPYIRMNHFDLEGRWNEDGLTRVDVDKETLAKYELRDGDPLFNTRNSFELVGKVALWSGKPSGYVYNNNILRLRFRPEVDAAFAFYQMMSPHFREYLRSEKSATTSVCAIYQRSVMAAPWSYPSKGRQRAIVNWIDAAYGVINRLASEATGARRLIDRLNQAVLAKAFRGELVPQDPADEPASMLLERIRAERAAVPKTRRGRKASVG